MFSILIVQCTYTTSIYIVCFFSIRNKTIVIISNYPYTSILFYAFLLFSTLFSTTCLSILLKIPLDTNIHIFMCRNQMCQIENKERKKYQQMNNNANTYHANRCDRFWIPHLTVANGDSTWSIAKRLLDMLITYINV